MKPHILLVSRDVVTLFGMGAILRSRYDVDIAFSASEAFLKLTHREYSAVLTAASLEDDNSGLSVARVARSVSDTPSAFITHSDGNQSPPIDTEAETVTLRLLSKRELLRRVDELIRLRGATFPADDHRPMLVWKRDD